MMKHFIYLLFCLPILYLSCDDDNKQNGSGELDYEELYNLKTEIQNRLDTAVVGIIDGTYPQESYKSLEEALENLNSGISKAKAGDLILQFEVENYILSAEKAIRLFEDARIFTLPVGTPAELYVNGVDHKGYIDFGSSPDYCGGPYFTVETWAKYDEGYIEFAFGSFIATFISPIPYKGWTLHYWGVGNTLLRFSIGTDDANPDLTLPTISTPAPTNYGKWFHIAAVHDSGAKKLLLYIDGELKSSTDLTANMVVNSSDDMRMWAFVEPKDNSRCISGYMKKFRIWNAAKSESEIKQLMDADVNGSEKDLVCAWDFTEKPEDDAAIPDKTGKYTAKLVGIYKWKSVD